MKVFYINLDRSADRRAYMEEILTHLGIEAERIPGVAGSNVPSWLAPQFAEPTPLTPGQIGDYASLLVVAKRIVDDALDYALVLQDDIIIDPRLMGLCEGAIWHLPKDWDCVHLDTEFKRAVVRFSALSREHSLVRFLRQPVGNGAFLLSKKGAQKWLEPHPRRLPSDVDNRRAWSPTTVFGVYPALVHHQREVLGSCIGGFDRGRARTSGIGTAFGNVLAFGPQVCARVWINNLINMVRKKIDGKRRVAVIIP